MSELHEVQVETTKNGKIKCAYRGLFFYLTFNQAEKLIENLQTAIKKLREQP